jgi:hypothetical protein
LPAELAERFVRDAGHGGQYERAAELVGTDFQGGKIHAGSVSRVGLIAVPGTAAT